MLITEPDKIIVYYQALIERNSKYIGVFYVCVKTTSVFCIVTCRARKPKFENVLFYTSFKEALDAGYRPCKVCKPTEKTNEAPESVKQAMQLVRDNPKNKVSDYNLRQLNISPELVRRWFKTHYGMTFQAYQRMYRINGAFLELKNGKKSLDTAYDSGYESLSGFGYTYKNLIGHSPKNSINQQVIVIDRLTTPLGPMFICATDKGICLLEFVDRRMLETEFKDLQRLLKTKIIVGKNKYIKQAKKEVQEYFDGKRIKFEVPIHTPGTAFQNLVWNCLINIKYGETSTYQQQADMINNPRAIRAVASANGFNRISIIVPCHRVIGKDGSLTGYGGGLERKQWLLDHEAATLNITSKLIKQTNQNLR